MMRLERQIGIDRLRAVAGEAARSDAPRAARRIRRRGRPRCAGPCGSDDDARRRVASSDGIGMRSEPAMRSDRMMMLTPSRTAASARAHSSSSACSMPAGAEAGMEGGVERARRRNALSATSAIERIFSRSASVRIGWRTSSRLVRGHALAGRAGSAAAR